MGQDSDLVTQTPFIHDRMEFTHTRVIERRRKPAGSYARVSGTLHRTVSQLLPMRIGGSREEKRTLTDLGRSSRGPIIASRDAVAARARLCEPAATAPSLAFRGAEVRSAWSSS